MGLGKRFGPMRRLTELAGLGNFKPTGLPIALDFGVSGMKVLQVAPGDPPSLVAAAYVPTPDNLLNDAHGRFDFQLDALPRIIKQGGFKGNRVACMIPATQTFCKHMQLARTDGASLAGPVQSAVASQLGCDPAALVLRHFEVGPVAGNASKTEVICTAVPRSLVNRLLDSTRRARLEMVGMHAEFSAVLRCFDSITKRIEDESLVSLYLDIGCAATKILIAHGRNPVFARCVDLGGKHMDEAVAAQLKCNIAEARSKRAASETFEAASVGAGQDRRVDGGLASMAGALRTEGGGNSLSMSLVQASLEERREGAPPPGLTDDLTAQPPAPPAPHGVDLREQLEILTDEVQMSLRYHGSLFPGRRVDRTVFIGGESRSKGLCQQMAKALRLPAQIADPLSRITKSGCEPATGVDLKEPQPGWAGVLGLCLSPTDL